MRPFVRAGELTVGIVHEVRNGLGTILGYARLVQSDGGPRPRRTRARIAQECETLEAVVRRFMEFVKDDSPASFRLRPRAHAQPRDRARVAGPDRVRRCPFRAGTWA